MVFVTELKLARQKEKRVDRWLTCLVRREGLLMAGG